MIAGLLLLGWSLATATARAADPTDSILTYGCDPPLPRTAANCAIWHTSLVNLRWTILDPNFVPVPGSQCDTTTISTDTKGTDVTCAVENQTSTQVSKTVTLRVDQTAPTITGANPARPADRNGWWNHSVAWAFQGTDATSGISSCDTVTYSGPDSATGTVSGDCRDVAGNAKTGQASVKYDATAPTVTSVTPVRPADHDGWWNHSVQWTFAGSDAMSGLASCDTVTYSGPDSASGTVSGDCRDVAGNAKTGQASIKYDDSPPNVTGATPARPADHNGWWNHSVAWAFQGSDPISGIAGCDTVTYSGPDTATASVSGACSDGAGNAASGNSPSFKYDDTGPTVTGATPGRPADHNGWWNHSVQWTFAGTDATSGLAGCDAPTYSGPDDVAGTVSGDCRDNAGNATTGRASIKYDGTAPTVTGATPGRPADHNGWWNHAVTWTFQASDATSGVDSCDAVPYSGPDDPAGDVAGACRDLAGNSATGHRAIKYDATAPTVTGAAFQRPPDHNGWWNYPVDVVFSGSDATSGIDSCDTITYSGPDGSTGTVSGYCRDVAGNAASKQTAIKYDDTPPAITAATPDRQPDHDGWWNHPVTITFSGTDATSGLAGCDTVDYSGPDNPAADVTGDCRDLAGNAGTGHFALKYDATPPTLSALPPEVGSDEAVLHWSASPDTVLTEVTRSPGIGGSPASTVYSGNGQSFADPGVKNDVTYTYSIRSSDAAGNQASVTVTLTPRAATAPAPDAALAPAPEAAPTPGNPPPRSSGTKPPKPPRLHWRRVKGADYYNVQLYRGTRKILSVWPGSTHLQLRLRWRFHGRLMELTPARYDWYAWPGFGSRSKRKYGHLIVHRSFTYAASQAAGARGREL